MSSKKEYVCWIPKDLEFKFATSWHFADECLIVNGSRTKKANRHTSLRKIKVTVEEIK